MTWPQLLRYVDARCHAAAPTGCGEQPTHLVAGRCVSGEHAYEWSMCEAHALTMGERLRLLGCIACHEAGRRGPAERGVYMIEAALMPRPAHVTPA